MALLPVGPHPGVNIQALAQNAAQNVLRRQRMRKLLQASAVMSGGGGGVSQLMRSSLQGRMTGARGHIQHPGFDAQTLAAMLRGAANQATLPGGGLNAGLGGMFAMGGGGYDFGSIADPSDPSQSPRSIDPTQVQTNPTSPGGPNPNVGGQPGTGYNSGPSQGQNTQAGPVYPGGDPTNVSLPGGTHGWIPLGGGMFYDPVNDIVRGQQQLNPIDNKF